MAMIKKFVPNVYYHIVSKKSNKVMEKKEQTKSVFEVLNSIDVNEHKETKNGLSYLSWAWAWAEVKKRYPQAQYTIYENANGLNYHTDGRTCWVKTGVTIDGLEHIEYLPVMDFRNASISRPWRVMGWDCTSTLARTCLRARPMTGWVQPFRRWRQPARRMS